MEQIIYMNGKLIAAQTGCLSLYDHGFLYGHGLFETMRAYQGNVFRLEAHLNRLARSMSVLGWPCVSMDELRKAVYSTIRANQLSDASIRLTLSRGIGLARPDATTCGSPTMIVFATPYVALSPKSYDAGWSLATVHIRRNLTSPLCSIKSANYLDNLLAKAEAQKQGGREALLLNTAGYVAEGTMCNLFFVIDGKLITPDIASGLLAGITRQVILELALQQGLLIEERPVLPDEITMASEAFLTSSLVELMPVTLLDGSAIGDGRPGIITKRLSAAYQQAATSHRTPSRRDTAGLE